MANRIEDFKAKSKEVLKRVEKFEAKQDSYNDTMELIGEVFIIGASVISSFNKLLGGVALIVGKIVQHYGKDKKNG